VAARVIPGGLFISKQTPAQPEKEKPGLRRWGTRLLGGATQRPDYLTPVGSTNHCQI
jgi:hypothetical protein